MEGLFPKICHANFHIILDTLLNLHKLSLNTMTPDTYKIALKQAKADLAEQVEILGRAQDCAEKAEKAIVELRQTIAALQRLCGEPEYVEEDALGLTDAIRMAFRTSDREMDSYDVREQMEGMGYAGRWGNLLASIQTVIPRLHKKGEIAPAGNRNGRDTWRWAGPRKSLGQRIADPERKPGQAPIPPASRLAKQLDAERRAVEEMRKAGSDVGTPSSLEDKRKK